jgi:hypothetical protein
MPVAKSPRKTAQFFLFFGAIWLLAGVGLAISGARDYAREKRFDRSAETAQAVVTGKSIKGASRNGASRTEYIVTYRFFPRSGSPTEGTDSVDVNEWEQLQPGRTMKVEFLPDTPAENRIARTRGKGSIIASLVLGCIFAPIGAALVVWSLRTIVRLSRELE